MISDNKMKGIGGGNRTMLLLCWKLSMVRACNSVLE